MPQLSIPEKLFIIFNGPLVDNEWQSARFYSGENYYKVYINPRIIKITDPVKIN
jgi:hypothetical protein